jgi:hypothetical protein
MAAQWWWEQEARRLAAAGDYKAAYEARLNVAFDVIEVERDSYAEELERKVIQLEAVIAGKKGDDYEECRSCGTEAGSCGSITHPDVPTTCCEECWHQATEAK